MADMSHWDELFEYKRKHAAKKEEEQKERDRIVHEAWVRDMQKAGLDPTKKIETPKKYCDHPNTMENGTATLFWIIIMVIGSIFKGNWVIWIVATAIWLKFILRHNK